jgi:hypothetical protein
VTDFEAADRTTPRWPCAGRLLVAHRAIVRPRPPRPAAPPPSAIRPHNLVPERAIRSTSRAERIAGSAGPNPTLTVSAGLSVSGQPACVEVTTSLSHPIELGGKRQLRREVADLGVTLAEAQLADALRQRLAEVKRAFHETLLARTTAEYATETRDGFGELITLNQTRLEEGAIAEAELLKVKLEHVRLMRRCDRRSWRCVRPGSGCWISSANGLLLGSVAGTLDGRPPHSIWATPGRRSAGASLRGSHAAALMERRVALERAPGAVDIEPFVEYRRAPGTTPSCSASPSLPDLRSDQTSIARAAASNGWRPQISPSAQSGPGRPRSPPGRRGRRRAGKWTVRAGVRQPRRSGGRSPPTRKEPSASWVPGIPAHPRRRSSMVRPERLRRHSALIPLRAGSGKDFVR